MWALVLAAAGVAATHATSNAEPAPGHQVTYTLATAQATGIDWWFTDGANPLPPAAGATQNVYINPAGSCQANPGETYSADYLGRLPAGGCRSDAECVSVLGGAADSWTCFAGVTGSPEACVDPATAPLPGTCICGSRAQNCP